jgi:pimeloyl-ACP methyl ester carboxylesterase
MVASEFNVSVDRTTVAQIIRDVGLDISESPDVALVRPESVAAALVNEHGAVLHASEAFSAEDAGRWINAELIARAARTGRPHLDIASVPAENGSETSLMFVYAPAALAGLWPLPPELRAAATVAREAVVVVTVSSLFAATSLEAASGAFGLSGLQARVALATIRSGGVRPAAEALGISYHTAREALAEAMKRVGVSRLPAFVQRLTSFAFGVLPDRDTAEAVADQWGLTQRQAAIAVLIADGLSRARAAASLGISEAVVKKELDQIYLLLHAGSAADLARRLAEANALRAITQATGGDIGYFDSSAEPVVFVKRPEGGRIAVSDYGPRSGKPVLVVHSSLTTRVVGRRLLRALQGAGYRPISIDRPGFGLTDEQAGRRPGEHDPYATAAEDAVLVLQRLKIAKLDVVARGGAQFVLALHRRAPELIDRVVLVNPDPHSTTLDRSVGPIGAFRQFYLSNPAIIRTAASVISRGLTYERTRRLLQAAMAGSAADELAIRDPEVVRDYFHAQRMFSTGRVAGYVNEQTDFVRASKPAPIHGTTRWRVLVAAHDTMHDPDHVLAYWREVLPDAVFTRVEDGGRLMALSQPEKALAALESAR